MAAGGDVPAQCAHCSCSPGLIAHLGRSSGGGLQTTITSPRWQTWPASSRLERRPSLSGGLARRTAGSSAFGCTCRLGDIFIAGPLCCPPSESAEVLKCAPGHTQSAAIESLLRRELKIEKQLPSSHCARSLSHSLGRHSAEAQSEAIKAHQNTCSPPLASLVARFLWALQNVSMGAPPGCRLPPGGAQSDRADERGGMRAIGRPSGDWLLLIAASDASQARRQAKKVRDSPE